MIRIVTDSTGNVAPSIMEEHRIEMVPLRVIFPDMTYRDQVDITAERFYEMLPGANPLPTTSQPPAHEFEEAFTRSAQGGDEVLAILISSGLSGTVASAVAAQRALPDFPITVFDSMTTAAPLAFMVEHAATRAAEGASMAEIVRDLETLRKRSRLLFTVETLEYLKKGGRIGGAAALAGSLLRIQPILTVNQQGTVEVWNKCRGKRKALQTIVDGVRQDAGTGSAVHVGVIHAAAPEEAAQFALDISQALDCPTARIMDISPVIGTHVGPQALGLGYYNRDWL